MQIRCRHKHPSLHNIALRSIFYPRIKASSHTAKLAQKKPFFCVSLSLFCVSMRSERSFELLAIRIENAGGTSIKIWFTLRLKHVAQCTYASDCITNTIIRNDATLSRIKSHTNGMRCVMTVSQSILPWSQKLSCKINAWTLSETEQRKNNNRNGRERKNHFQNWWHWIILLCICLTDHSFTSSIFASALGYTRSHSQSSRKIWTKKWLILVVRIFSFCCRCHGYQNFFLLSTFACVMDIMQVKWNLSRRCRPPFM